jgi:hypothetical protein
MKVSESNKLIYVTGNTPGVGVYDASTLNVRDELFPSSSLSLCFPSLSSSLVYNYTRICSGFVISAAASTSPGGPGSTASKTVLFDPS